MGKRRPDLKVNHEPSPGLPGGETPEPPWWTRSRPRPPARVPLTRDAIVDAALVVLDREGVDGLSMRRVAEELGTGAASLYWHVRNKEELYHLILEQIMHGIELPPPDPSLWRAQMKELARQTRTAMGRHRDVARISLGRVPVGPGMAQVAEWALALLRQVGVPDRIVAYALDMMALYVAAFAFEESLGLASPAGEEMPPEETLAMMRDYFASLPADRFPNLVTAADTMFGGDSEERFEFALDLILDGMERMASQGQPPPAGPRPS